MSDEVHDEVRSLRDAIASREALIQSLRDVVANLEGRMAALESALVNTANENEILKRRLFGPRSERSGTSELQLTLGNLLEEQKQLQKKLDEAVRKSKEGDAAGASCVDGDEPPKKEPPTKPSPKGRRNLAESSLPRVRVDLRDADIEASGGRFIRWETSFELMRQQAAWKVLEKRTAQYEISVAGKKSVLGVEQPPKLLRRSMLHTSTIAWLLVQKFALGVPHPPLGVAGIVQGPFAIVSELADAPSDRAALFVRQVRPSQRSLFVSDLAFDVARPLQVAMFLVQGLIVGGLDRMNEPTVRIAGEKVTLQIGRADAVIAGPVPPHAKAALGRTIAQQALLAALFIQEVVGRDAVPLTGLDMLFQARVATALRPVPLADAVPVADDALLFGQGGAAVERRPGDGEPTQRNYRPWTHFIPPNCDKLRLARPAMNWP